MHLLRLTRWLMLGLCVCICLQPGVAWVQEWQTHSVSRGQNLTIIARKYKVTVAELREWNNLRTDRITVGQQLRIGQPDHQWYVVKSGDSLSEIAQRHDIALSLLKRLNNLSGSRIYPGQKLKLRPTRKDEAVYVVRAGDNLTFIARDHGLSVAQLKDINDLTGSRIYVGQQLRLREVSRSSHVVERGDALWEIARAYGVSVERLKEINGLTSNRIHPGQELRLDGHTAARVAEYVVRRGDNLTEIARLHQMSLRELRSFNNLRGSVIHPGQKLKVRPQLGSVAEAAPSAVTTALDWSALSVSVPGVRRIQAGNGPYYYESPKAANQQGRTYCEESSISPRQTYSHAKKLLKSFDAKVAAQTRLSNRLAGWRIVLDPGHGGIDPGTIVAAKDAAGAIYYIVEDEYVYDVALRAYALLKLHGAEVSLTLLSPNHLLRSNEPVSETFVHDRNEVFNDQKWNRSNRPACWPKGGQKYLDERVAIARSAFKGAPAAKQLFLSFHADNDPVAGDAMTLFYYQSRRSTDTRSRDFARKLLPSLGAGARTKGRALGVLRNNPARYKLLVETRNLAYPEHIWAMRYESLRQRDAEKVVQALLDAIGS